MNILLKKLVDELQEQLPKIYHVEEFTFINGSYIIIKVKEKEFCTIHCVESNLAIFNWAIYEFDNWHTFEDMRFTIEENYKKGFIDWGYTSLIPEPDIVFDIADPSFDPQSVIDYIVKSGDLWYKKSGYSLKSLFEGIK